jgi:hypothetical protein
MHKRRKITSFESVTLTSKTRPEQLEQDITLKPSERVVSNNGMTINKRAGTNKNRHLFVLPGLLQANVLQQQIIMKKKKIISDEHNNTGIDNDNNNNNKNDTIGAVTESQTTDNEDVLLSQTSVLEGGNTQPDNDSEGIAKPQKKAKKKVKVNTDHLQIGNITKLGTTNPELFLELNGGRLKLIGEIVYPKNRFITLQCLQQGGNKVKDVLCDNTFDSVVVFNQAEFVCIHIYNLLYFLKK